MTEAQEVASVMSNVPKGLSMDELRRIVRGRMQDETEQVIDNVAYALWQKARRE